MSDEKFIGFQSFAEVEREYPAIAQELRKAATIETVKIASKPGCVGGWAGKFLYDDKTTDEGIEAKTHKATHKGTTYAWIEK